jgi:hypothetical protein
VTDKKEGHRKPRPTQSLWPAVGPTVNDSASGAPAADRPAPYHSSKRRRSGRFPVPARSCEEPTTDDDSDSSLYAPRRHARKRRLIRRPNLTSRSSLHPVQPAQVWGQGGGEDRDGGLGVSGRVVYTQQMWKGVIIDERDPQVL